MEVETIKYLGMYVTKVTPKSAPDLIKQVQNGAKSIDIVRKFTKCEFPHNQLSCIWLKNEKDRFEASKNIEKIAESNFCDTFVRVNKD